MTLLWFKTTIKKKISECNLQGNKSREEDKVKRKLGIGKIRQEDD